MTTEVQFSPRNLMGSGGRETEKWMTILPGEGPSGLGRSNCDSLSPKRCSNVGVMNRGVSDEAIVIVKFGADEVMVTWRG